MAQSPTHKFGQIIGDMLEGMLRGPLGAIAARHGFYLDYKHPRPARGNKRKVAWTDQQGNEHDLDYVLERGGSENEQGLPKAFIETAWRRYTKHSRNKAQEIQGAILPLAAKYSACNPFLGAVLAGVFTEGSLQQLRTNGFCVLYLPYDSIVRAFSRAGIDASFDEETADNDVRRKVDVYDALSRAQKARIPRGLQKDHATELDAFLQSLEQSLTRKLLKVYVVALHGATCEVSSVEEALKFLEGYDESRAVRGFVRYEVNAKYSNGDQITGEFQDKSAAIAFLKGL
jgi:hypothetical protein